MFYEATNIYQEHITFEVITFSFDLQIKKKNDLH